MTKKLFYVLISLGILGGLVRFFYPWFRTPSTSTATKTEGTLRITTTTGMIQDAVKHVAGAHATVTALMGPGVDPHAYKTTPADLKKLKEADIIFHNDLHLEGKMGQVLANMARQKPIYAVSEGLMPEQLIRDPNFSTGIDPHIWFDVSLWIQVIQYISQQLQRCDPTHAATYKRNEADYTAKLQKLHSYIQKRLSVIPSSQRVLITAHDAFGYFGRAYGLQVRGLQGISTMAEYGLKDVTNLVNFIVKNKIKAIFIETSVPDKPMRAVVEACKQQGHVIQLGGQLYSDAMGAEGTPEGTYEGMIIANVDIIVKALQ